MHGKLFGLHELWIFVKYTSKALKYLQRIKNMESNLKLTGAYCYNGNWYNRIMKAKMVVWRDIA